VVLEAPDGLEMRRSHERVVPAVQGWRSKGRRDDTAMLVCEPVAADTVTECRPGIMLANGR
jgi:hypothetical protein